MREEYDMISVSWFLLYYASISPFYQVDLQIGIGLYLVAEVPASRTALAQTL